MVDKTKNFPPFFFVKIKAFLSFQSNGSFSFKHFQHYKTASKAFVLLKELNPRIRLSLATCHARMLHLNPNAKNVRQKVNFKNNSLLQLAECVTNTVYTIGGCVYVGGNTFVSSSLVHR